jgi:hypothetical protein
MTWSWLRPWPWKQREKQVWVSYIVREVEG